MMKYKLFVLYKTMRQTILLSLLCGLFSFNNANAHSQSQLPFIYYYSLENKGFIVERVDGTEHQLLASYGLDADDGTQVAILGAGWSPSGKLFTWMSRSSEGGESYAKNVYFVDASGKSLKTASASDKEGIDSVEWSPTNDLLLILAYDTSDVITPIVTVYDPVKEKYLFRYTSPDIPQYPPQQIHWSPDGAYIAVSGSNSIQILPLNSERKIVTLERWHSKCNECNYGTLPRWLTDGHLAFVSSDAKQLILTNVDKNENTFIQLPSGEIHLIDWSPDEQNALIYVQSSKGDKFQLWLLSRKDQTTKLVSNNAWFTNNYGLPFSETLWSEDSQHAAFVSGDGQLSVVSASGDVANLNLQNKGDIRTGSRIAWAANDKLLFTGYNAASDVSELYQYDLNKSEIENLSTLMLTSTTSISDFSAHGDMLFSNGFLVNLDNQTITEFVPSGDLHIEVGRTDAVRWHPSGDWLFLLSMYNSLYWVKLASTIGTISPEIALCPIDSRSCYGWLPNNVNMGGIS